MLDEKLELFEKGSFDDVNEDFIKEGTAVLQKVDEVQQKYNKHDTDTFTNELRDSITGRCLGFDLVNTEKHGLDCKKKNEEKYLEVKAASFSSKSWAATFNDTTLEKADAFKDKKVFLALSVWKNASDLLFICYGQNEKIGEYLEAKVKDFQANKSKISTQTISLSNLVFNYNFNILAVGHSVDEVHKILKEKSRTFNKLDKSRIIHISEFDGV